MDDARLCHHIYATFATTGTAPAVSELEPLVGGADAVAAALRRLHDARSVVLGVGGEIRMALPFSAVATDHVVRSERLSWWANCAWDSLAIPTALEADAEIDATWLDTGERVELAVIGGEPSSLDGYIHFGIPARRWWDDIVDT